MATITELREAMNVLARDERVLFIGQSVVYGGQRAATTFDDIPKERKVEMPIAEDFTIGYAIGLSMTGIVPLVFIPRMDFLLCAMNQVCNHLDAIGDRLGAKVIIRTAIGSRAPLDPGPQHSRNCVDGFRRLLRNVDVIDLGDRWNIGAKSFYQNALERKGSTIIVERMDEY